MKPVFPYPWILQMHHRDFQDQFKVWGAITVIWNNSPQSCPYPGPGTCEHVTSVGRGDFAGGLKYKPLRRWIPGVPVSSQGPYKREGEGQRQRGDAVLLAVRMEGEAVSQG